MAYTAPAQEKMSVSVEHYENFPVASVLVPAHLRGAVRDIYRFARTADDIADEGEAPPETRLAQLGAYGEALEQIAAGRLELAEGDPRASVFEPLAMTIVRHDLPVQPFFDLLSAFEQDVHTQRYETDAALFDYCTRSANPVGHLILHLYKAMTPLNRVHADAICTGLQLTNFWQDVAIDRDKGRIYLPAETMRRFGVDEGQIAEGVCDASWEALMAHQTSQARQFLRRGLPLTTAIPGRAGFELRLVVQGGLRILERLDQLNYDMFRHRPTLKKRDWFLLLYRALRQRRPGTFADSPVTR